MPASSSDFISNLLRNTDLFTKIESLKTQADMQKGMAQLFSKIETISDFSDPNLPYYALLALEQEKISEAQFTTIILRWSAFKDYDNDIASVTLHTLDSADPKTTRLLKKYLRLEDLNVLGTDDLTKHEFQAFLTAISSDDLPASEKQFMILDLQEDADIKPLFQAFHALGFSLFMPQQTNDGHYQLIVPSMSIITQVLKTIGREENPITLIPRIGEDSAEDVYEFHKMGQHPLGLSFPGYERSEADGQDGGCLGFSLHDVYHTVLLKHLDNLPMLNHLVEVSHRFADSLEDPRSQEKVKQNAFFFIDGELRQSLIKKRQVFGNYSLPILQDPAYFLYNCLTAFLLTKPLLDKVAAAKTAKRETTEPADVMKLKALLKKSEPSSLLKQQLIYLFQDIFRHPEEWAKLGINPATFYNIVFEHHSGFNEVQSLLNTLQEQTESHGNLLFLGLNAFQQSLKLGQEALSNEASDFPWMQERSVQEMKLYRALSQGDIATLELLLDSSEFKTHLASLSFAPPPSHTESVLSAALACDTADSIIFLGKHGLDMDTVLNKDTLSTSLHIATHLKKPLHVKALLEAGANPFLKDKDEKHAIDIAIATGDKETLLIFLQAGVSPSFTYLKLLEHNKQIHQDCQSLIKDYIHFKQALMAIDDIYQTEKQLEKINALKGNNPHHLPINQCVDPHSYDETALSEPDIAAKDLNRGQYQFLFSDVRAIESMKALKAISPFNPNQRNSAGQTLLMTLCGKAYYRDRERHLARIKWLITQGADITLSDNDNKNALDIALETEQYEVANVLLAAAPELISNMSIQKRSTSLNVLILAMANNQLNEKMQTLLGHMIKAGFNLNLPFLTMKTPPSASSILMPQDINEYLCTQTLWSYIRHAPIWVQEVQLGLGYNLFSHPDFKLNGHIDAPLALRQLCLENGANPNQPNFDGQPELFYAIEHNYVDYAKLLIEKGCDVDQTDEDGLTALHIAAQKANPIFISLLLEAGALSLPDEEGKLPLDYLADTESIEAFQCKKLLTPKPKLALTAQTSFLKTPKVDVATQTETPQDDIESLLSYGAGL